MIVTSITYIVFRYHTFLLYLVSKATSIIIYIAECIKTQEDKLVIISSKTRDDIRHNEVSP